MPVVKQLYTWADSIKETDLEPYKNPQAWATPALAVAATIGFSAFYRTYLRRIPSANAIQPRFFRRRSLLGKVTSVGDGDGFHLYHTPGGRFAGWGWLRKVPAYRKDLKGKTISIRIAGIDAPECAHFGRPAQPYSSEAMDFLTYYLLGRRVRVYPFRRDQYDRVVSRVTVRRFFFFRRDVGVELLKRGLATCYDAKTGAEFGGREAQYRVTEAKAKSRKRGLWGGGSGLETPREYKARMTALDAEKEATIPATTSPATTTASPAAAATLKAAPAGSPAKPATPTASTTATTSLTKLTQVQSAEPTKPPLAALPKQQ